MHKFYTKESTENIIALQDGYVAMTSGICFAIYIYGVHIILIFSIPICKHTENEQICKSHQNIFYIQRTIIIQFDLSVMVNFLVYKHLSQTFKHL